MSSASIRRQDESGLAGMPLCLWWDGELVGAVEDHNAGGELMDRLVAEGAVGSFEILLPCRQHPLNPAVDCLDCEPAEAGEDVA